MEKFVGCCCFFVLMLMLCIRLHHECTYFYLIDPEKFLTGLRDGGENDVVLTDEENFPCARITPDNPMTFTPKNTHKEEDESILTKMYSKQTEPFGYGYVS